MARISATVRSAAALVFAFMTGKRGDARSAAALVYAFMARISRTVRNVAVQHYAVTARLSLVVKNVDLALWSSASKAMSAISPLCGIKSKIRVA
jgi:hypothetical protein